MIDAQEMQERHARWLARYGELAMALAEQLHEDAMAAETPDERRKAAASFHRIARCGRQSMALEARFVRDAQRAAREAVEELKTERQARVDARKRRSTTG